MPITWLCPEHGHRVIGTFVGGNKADVLVIREDQKNVPKGCGLRVPCLRV